MTKTNPVNIDLTQATPLTEEQRKNAQPFNCIIQDEDDLGLERSIEWKIVHAQRTEMRDLLGFPNSSVGKLYSVVDENAETREITIEKGTAFVVGKNVLMTAAHCVYGALNGEFDYFKRFEYYPAYPFATSPIRIKQAWVPDNYRLKVGDTELRIPYDYGFLITEEPIPGIVLNLDVSAPDYDCIRSIGYPDQYPFKGLQYFCEGDARIEAQQITMNSNDMVPGCSGGPWMYNNTVIGINSTRQHSIITREDGSSINMYQFFSPIITQEVIDIAEAFSVDENIPLAASR